jgi:hypothetical protein
VENERLLADVQRANRFLGAVMDELDTGAIAVDAADVIQAVNRPVREYLGLEEDPRGRAFDSIFAGGELLAFKDAVTRCAGDEEAEFCDVDLEGHRFRVARRRLVDESGEAIGFVVLFREISHEPLQRRFNEVLGAITSADEELRAQLEAARDQLPALAEEVRASPVESLGMSELAERISRTRTAVDHWLEVDDAMAREDFPDAQLLQDRMRIAMSRWPLGDEAPKRVLELATRVEEYYESGEKSRQHVL